jgi:hypothetical protein
MPVIADSVPVHVQHHPDQGRMTFGSGDDL